MLGHCRQIRTVLIVCLVIILIPEIPGASDRADGAVSQLVWGTIETPGSDPFTVVSPSEANQFALFTDANSNTSIYLTDIPNSRVLKSTNSGAGWLAVGTSLTAAGAVLPAYMVAVAPEDGEFVVAVTNARKRVYYSIDGGTNWASTKLEDLVPPLGANEQISDIEVTPEYLVTGNYARDIVVCTRDSTPGPGRVLILQLLPLGLGAWKDQLAPAQGYSRIRFSPNYASDMSLIAVGSNAADTFLNIGARDPVTNTIGWNAAVASNWPVDITGAVPGPDWAQLITSDIVLPNDFYGQTSYYRRIYVCFDDNNATGRAGVYYLDNYTVYNLNFSGSRPYSLAGKGSYSNIKLLASSVTGASPEGIVPVYYATSPSPGATVWMVPYKYPSGAFGSTQSRTIVRWNTDGSKAYVATFSTLAIDSAAAWYTAANWGTGTANDESALSVSINDSYSWNQVGYIDTTIRGLNDLAVSRDGSTAYIASWNTGINLESIWRTRSTPLGDTWERVLCTVSASDQPIVRLAPESLDGSIVFWANTGSRMVQRSWDSGQTWQDTQARLNVRDMALVSAYSAYVLQNDGKVSKGGSAAYNRDIWIWGSPIFTGIETGHTIAVQGDTVVIGGSFGSRIAYSLDGGSNFRVTPELPTIGNQHVAIDPAFHESRYFYVADDSPTGQIYRWRIGGSRDWNNEVISAGAGPRFGIVVTSEATRFGPALYSPISLIGGWMVERTLSPRAPLAKEIRQSWDYLTSGLPTPIAFASEPSALKISGVSPNVIIWALDTSGANRLLAFNDSITLDSPAIIAPIPDQKTGAVAIPVAPDGLNAPFGLRWDTVGTSSEYEAQISSSPDFSDVVALSPWVSPGPPFFVPVNPEQPGWLINLGTLMSGQTYYARVRVRRASSGQVIRTMWSPAVKLALSSQLPVGANYAGPRAVFPTVGALGQRVEEMAFSWAPVSGATEYRFVLSMDPSFSNPIVNNTVPSTVFTYMGTLDYRTTYFWQVWATKPVPGEKSPVFTFTTVDQPVPIQDPQLVLLPSPEPVVVSMPPVDESMPPWAWVVVGVSGLLTVTMIVAAVAVRRP